MSENPLLETEITNSTGAPIPVSATTLPLPTGAATEATLSALNAKIVSNPLTNTELRASAVPVLGPLTNTELRASAVPVSGSAAVGTAPTAPPLSVAGVDSGGLKRHLLTDTAGVLIEKIKGNSDGTLIGNISDKLKVTDTDVLSAINILSAALGASTTSIFKFNEVANPAKTETDLASTTYTVPAGKRFLLQSFAASYDAQAAIIVRFKKQTGGAGSFVTQFKIVMNSGGQGDQTLSYSLGSGINLGAAGDVFKITVESSIAKGTLWAEFSGAEV